MFWSLYIALNLMNSVSQICTLTHTKSRCHTFRKCIWWWLDIGVWLWRISGCREWANEVVIYQVNFENDHINFCGQHLPLIESLHIMASVVITRTRKNSCTMFYYVQLIKRNYCLHCKCDVGNVIRINRSIKPDGRSVIWISVNNLLLFI